MHSHTRFVDQAKFTLVYLHDRAMAVEAARQAEAAAEREERAASARRELEKEAVSAARLRMIRARRVSLLKASTPPLLYGISANRSPCLSPFMGAPRIQHL